MVHEVALGHPGPVEQRRVQMAEVDAVARLVDVPPATGKAADPADHLSQLSSQAV